MRHSIHVMSVLMFILSAVGCSDSTDPDPTVGPELSVGVSSLHFATDQNTLTFTIENAGTGSLEWSVSGDADWISTDLESGETTHETVEVVATVDRVGQAVGPHACSLTVSSNGGTETIDVTMDASPLALSSYELHFAPDDSLIQLEIFNCDTGTLDWTLAVDQDWVLVEPTSGSTGTERDTVSIRFDSEQLESGTCPAVITVSEAGAAKGLKWGGAEAALTHEYYSRPRLIVVREGINELRCWSDTEVDILVGNRAVIPGGLPLDWIATCDQPWLSVMPDSGDISCEDESESVTIVVDKSGFTRGTVYWGTVTISSNGGYAQVRVRCADPIVGVSPASLDFGEEETALPLTIFNEGSGPLDDHYFAWEVRSSESWLTASNTVGTLDSDHREEEIEVYVSRTGLEPGTYTGELTALSLCSTQDAEESKTVAVSMEVPESQSGATLVMGLSHTGQDPYDLNDVLTIQLDLQIDGQGNITGSGTGTHTTLSIVSNSEDFWVQNIVSVPIPFTFVGTASGTNNDMLDFTIVPPEPSEPYAYRFELCNEFYCNTFTDGICPTVMVWNDIHFVIDNRPGAQITQDGVEDFGGGGYTYDWNYTLTINRTR